MGREETQEFEWITKLILAANEGKVPNFSVQDQALVERIATVPHRSRFQAPGLPLDEEYTFPADVSIKNKFEGWLPYMLRWALKGLERYYTQGFTNMPQGCLAFKQELLEEKDIVKEWLDLSVQVGEARDYIKVNDLFQSFTADNRDLQRDKKTKKTAKMFERELHRCLGTTGFKEKHQYRVEGRKVTLGKVFMGYKRTE